MERQKDLTKTKNSQKITNKVPQASNNDNELDKTKSNEEITEIEQTRTNLIKAKEVYLITFNHRKWQEQNIPWRGWWSGREKGLHKMNPGRYQEKS